MANSTIVGNATVYGVDGTVKYGTVTIGENYMQSINLTDEMDTSEARDQRGNVFGYNLYNHRRTAAFEIIFYAATEAGAAAEFLLPTPGAIVEIRDDPEDGATLPGDITGDWNYVGNGTISGSNTDLMRMSLPCSRYADPAGTTTAAVALQTI